jgi:hypothetical protein
MEISVHSLTFLLGCVLIVVAIIGGGFEITQIRIPKVGFIARTMAAIFGSILLLVSMGNPEFFSGMNDASSSRRGSTSSGGEINLSPKPEIQEAFYITIYNEAVGNQIFERINVDLSGQGVGQLVSDRNRPLSSTYVKLIGRYHNYRISGISIIQVGSRQHTRIVSGEGVIDARESSQFELFVDGEWENQIIVSIRRRR